MRLNKRNKNSFVVKRLAGNPPSPYDFQSNRLVLLQPEDEEGLQILPHTKYNGRAAGHSALMTGCRLDLSTPLADVRK